MTKVLKYFKILNFKICNNIYGLTCVQIELRNTNIVRTYIAQNSDAQQTAVHHSEINCFYTWQARWHRHMYIICTHFTHNCILFLDLYLFNFDIKKSNIKTCKNVLKKSKITFFHFFLISNFHFFKFSIVQVFILKHNFLTADILKYVK